MTTPAAPAPLRHLRSGKVRDLYETPDGLLLLVASDRISAYDRVLPTPIPDKGAILTALSRWWFEQLADLGPNHLVDRPDAVPAELAGRTTVSTPLDMVAVECVARGYLAGSALTEYATSGAVCGVALPPGLREGDRLPEPIFTPATKAEHGAHDENVSLDHVAATVGADLARELRDRTLAVYARAAGLAADRGILVADTKLEFGRDPRTGALVLADEVLTPDSSRFWPADAWSPGGPQPSYDKQFVRDWLRAHWDGTGDPPPLPGDVVAATRARYVEAYERLTGRRWT